MRDRVNLLGIFILNGKCTHDKRLCQFELIGFSGLLKKLYYAPRVFLRLIEIRNEPIHKTAIYLCINILLKMGSFFNFLICHFPRFRSGQVWQVQLISLHIYVLARIYHQGCSDFASEQGRKLCALSIPIPIPFLPKWGKFCIFSIG
jgi:hypothetical protein